MRSTSVVALALCAGAAVTSVANAQNGLVVGVDDPTVPVQVYQNGSWNTLFSGVEAWGLAAVNSEERIYFNDGSALSYWSQSDGIVNVGTINVGGTTISVTGLTYSPVDDALYATRNVGGDGGATPEALYKIDRTTGVAALVDDYASGDFDFGGLGIDAITNRIFGTSDDSTPASGLYELNPGSAYNLIAPYPSGETDIDGLAVYNDIAYLVTDEPGDFYLIDVNNPAAGYTTFPSPFTTSEIFSGAAVAEWLIPSPGALAVFGLGGLAAVRRRR